ncbi:hemolysin family protein [Mobilicoccus massiliensis]|uniref:hemolysin family protein n=1 Tax=Mobilicoccus massiliensis TaxID=1522310 RepID=UPI00058D083F|nr:hemolysin family protein [Mobilicoccus massiliensis]
MTTAWILTGCVVLLVALNALFVAVEFSYLTVDRGTVERRAAEGDDRARRLDGHLRTLSSQLSGAQLGITVTSLVVGFIAEPSIATLLVGAFGAFDFAGPAATAVALAAAFVIATFSQMVFGELVPKNWGIAQPTRVAWLVVWPQTVFMTLFGWVVRLFDAGANAVVRLLGFEPTDELAQARTPEELRSVVRRSGREGTLDDSTAELVARSIEFGRRTAGEVMKPRPRVDFLTSTQSVQDVVEAARRTGHSRFPVTGDDVDDIVGLVHVKQAVGVPFEQRATTPVTEVVVDAQVVPESMTLDPLLRRLREPGLQLAIVVDEYGGTAGIVSLEDLVEEIVGEIGDEHDRDPILSRRSGRAWVVSGLLRPDELGDLLELELPEGRESDTLGGLVTEMLDRMPEPGDRVVLDAVDEVNRDEVDLPTPAYVDVTVMRMEGHRVASLHVRVRRPRASVATAVGRQA